MKYKHLSDKAILCGVVIITSVLTLTAYGRGCNEEIIQGEVTETISVPLETTESSVGGSVESTDIDTSTNSYEVVEEVPYTPITMYAKTGLNVREEPCIDTNSIGLLYFNQEVVILSQENGWGKIQYSDRIGYVSMEYMAEESAEYKIYLTPLDDSFKSFMGVDKITDITSPQYAFKPKMYVGNYGIMMAGNRYCIAVGSYYTTTIGTYIDLVVQHEDYTTSIIPCVLGDCKDDKDTDPETHRQNPNGSIAEFIVDESRLVSSAWQSGSISSVAREFDGEIIEVRVYE